MQSLKAMFIRMSVMLLLSCMAVALVGCERRPIDQVAVISAARQPPIVRAEISDGNTTSGASNTGSSASSAQEDCAAKKTHQQD
jgi:hypothetical protein